MAMVVPMPGVGSVDPNLRLSASFPIFEATFVVYRHKYPSFSLEYSFSSQLILVESYR